MCSRRNRTGFKANTTLGQELCLSAAMKLYELGKLSSGAAAQLASIERVVF